MHCVIASKQIYETSSPLSCCLHLTEWWYIHPQYWLLPRTFGFSRLFRIHCYWGIWYMVKFSVWQVRLVTSVFPKKKLLRTCKFVVRTSDIFTKDNFKQCFLSIPYENMKHCDFMTISWNSLVFWWFQGILKNRIGRWLVNSFI